MVATETDFTEQVADTLAEALPEGVTITTKKGGRRGKGGTTATVSKSKAKQDDLPSMEEHQRRIPEIEDLADLKDELEQQLSALKEKFKDADENLVASMKRHERTYYARQTWGSVVLTEARVKAKVTKQIVASKDDEDPEAEAAE